MSNLTDLVPPLELCKLIPEGEFYNSAFQWQEGYGTLKNAEYYAGVIVRTPWEARGYKHLPAPFTDEILDACKDIPGVLNPTLWYQAGTWIADCAYDRSGKLSEEFFQDEDCNNLDIIEGKGDTPVVAAMRLWLKLKGIENE